MQDPHKRKIPKKEELPNGRPLFSMELRRNENPRHTYDVRRNVDIEQVMNTKKPPTFGNSYEQYRKTCDIQNDIKVFDFAAKK